MNAMIDNQQSEGRNELRPYGKMVGAQFIAPAAATSGNKSS